MDFAYNADGTLQQRFGVVGLNQVTENFQYDTLGRQFLDVLAEKAKQGIEVRLLYDAMGSRKIGWWRD